MAFSNDGAKMFVVGDDGNEINEYALSTPFDVSTASHDSIFSVSAQETFPQGMAFSNDGAKMFVVGDDGNRHKRYALSSVYPITVTVTDRPIRPPPTFVSSTLDRTAGTLAITFSETIDVTPATNAVPTKIHVRESGTYEGGVTFSAGDLITSANSATISFNLTESHLETVAGLTTPELTIEPGAVQGTSGNLIEGTFDASTIAYVRAFTVGSKDFLSARRRIFKQRHQDVCDRSSK